MSFLTRVIYLCDLNSPYYRDLNLNSEIYTEDLKTASHP